MSQPCSPNTKNSSRSRTRRGTAMNTINRSRRLVNALTASGRPRAHYHTRWVLPAGAYRTSSDRSDSSPSDPGRKQPLIAMDRSWSECRRRAWQTKSVAADAVPDRPQPRYTAGHRGTRATRSAADSRATLPGLSTPTGMRPATDRGNGSNESPSRPPAAHASNADDRMQNEHETNRP